MKKPILFFILIFTATFSFTQTNVYHPFPGNSALWKVDCGVNADPCYGAWTDNYILTGTDTSIGTYQYKKIYDQGVICYGPNPCYCSPYSGNGSMYYYAAIRDDSAAKKVYIAISGIDSLLYDFNLNLGDTLQPSYINYSYQNYVSKIDSVLIGGDYHKQFWLSVVGGGGSYPPNYIAIIEGIGSTFGLLSELVPPFESGCSLNCFSIDSIPVYPDTATVCSSLTAVLHNYGNTISFVIFPNPSTDHITIEAPQSACGGAAIEIKNIQGQLIKTFTATGNKTNIDVSAFPSGVYIIEAKTEKGVEVKKFVKE